MNKRLCLFLFFLLLCISRCVLSDTVCPTIDHQPIVFPNIPYIWRNFHRDKPACLIFSICQTQPKQLQILRQHYCLFSPISEKRCFSISGFHKCLLFVCTNVSPSTNQPPFWVPTDHLYLVWSANNWQLTYCLLSVWSTDGDLSTMICYFILILLAPSGALYVMMRHYRSATQMQIPCKCHVFVWKYTQFNMWSSWNIMVIIVIIIIMVIKGHHGHHSYRYLLLPEPQQ